MVACHLGWTLAHTSGYQSRSSSGAPPVSLLLLYASHFSPGKEDFDELVRVSVKINKKSACPFFLYMLPFYWIFYSLQNGQPLFCFCLLSQDFSFLPLCFLLHILSLKSLVICNAWPIFRSGLYHFPSPSLYVYQFISLSVYLFMSVCQGLEGLMMDLRG